MYSPGGRAADVTGRLQPRSTYVKPPAVAPAAYKEVPPEFKEGTGWKLAQPGDDKLPMKWWEMYNDPQLNALEEQVKISNQSIAAAEANYRAAQAVAMAARAGLYPTVGASTSYTNSRSSSTSRATTTTGTAAGTTTTGTTTTGTTTNSPPVFPAAALLTTFRFPSALVTQPISGIKSATPLPLTSSTRRQMRPISLRRF